MDTKIKFNKNDDFNTIQSDNDFELLRSNFFRNNRKLSKLLVAEVFSNVTFIVMGIIIPIIMLTIIFITASLMGVYDGVVGSLINLMILFPISSILMYVIPSYIFSARESNWFKRLSNIGLSRIQLFVSTILTTFIITTLISLFMFFVTPIIIYYIINLFMEMPQYSSFFDYSNVNWLLFLSNLIVGVLGMTGLAIFIGMKAKTMKSSQGMGTGLFIFSYLSIGVVPLFLAANGNDQILYGSGATIATIVSFIWILTPFSIFTTSVLVTTDSRFFEQTAPFAIFVVVLSFIVSISIIVIMIIRNKKIINYEAGR